MVRRILELWSKKQKSWMHLAMCYTHSGFIILTEVADWSHQFSKKEKLAKPDVNLKCQFLSILKMNLAQKIPLVLTQFINAMCEDFLMVLGEILCQTDVSQKKKKKVGGRRKWLGLVISQRFKEVILGWQMTYGFTVIWILYLCLSAQLSVVSFILRKVLWEKYWSQSLPHS